MIFSLMPAGFHTRSLSTQHNGVLASPRFRVESDFISIHAAGGAGAQMRLMVDNYPLPSGQIFPVAKLTNARAQWIQLDVKYRRGSWAYLEFATEDDPPRREKREFGAPSWFAADAVVFHDADHAPRDTEAARDVPGDDPAARLTTAIRAWREDRASEPERALLDECIRRELLPVRLAGLPGVAPLVADYRRIEAAVPEPRRIPGMFEVESMDAPMLPRGEHAKPGDLVPRGYLSAIDATAFNPHGSGRLELARAITDPRNPLTARVMVNRVWQWLFGRGLVATPDNFGRMGEQPTHPELLDFLAAKFQAPESEGGFAWSFKKLIRYLATTRAFALASEPPARAAEIDPANALLTHARVRRLEAEAIRDTLLVRAGQLTHTMSGPGDSSAGKPEEHKRRSVYQVVRRNALSPFLAVFDAPRPFATTGRRDETNVPAQSLALLNDPLVVHCAAKWADRTLAAHSDTDSRLRTIFTEAFARPPRDAEIDAARRFLADREADPAAWRELAHSLIDAKEFIYLR